MQLTAEVIGKFDHTGDANRLLYTPTKEAHQYRESRRYHVDFSGDQNALEEFLQRVLANETSHELSLGEAPALADWSLLLDYGMKPGALDLEKETILAYYRSLTAPGFELVSLKIERRIYLYGVQANQKQSTADAFVRDIVNPAIHHHRVQLSA